MCPIRVHRQTDRLERILCLDRGISGSVSSTGAGRDPCGGLSKWTRAKDGRDRCEGRQVEDRQAGRGGAVSSLRAVQEEVSHMRQMTRAQISTQRSQLSHRHSATFVWNTERSPRHIVHAQSNTKSVGTVKMRCRKLSCLAGRSGLDGPPTASRSRLRKLCALRTMLPNSNSVSDGGSVYRFRDERGPSRELYVIVWATGMSFGQSFFGRTRP